LVLRELSAAALGIACLPFLTGAAHAYTSAGDRTFPATLILPQAAPADQIYVNVFELPQISGGPGGPTRQTDVTETYSKTITDRLGISEENTYTRIDQFDAKSLNGVQNVDTSIKYEAILDEPHEFLLTLSLDREFGDTGTARVGAYDSGATTPSVFFEKGLGDLDIGYLRPLAITGNAGYTIADSRPRPNLAVAGGVIEYSFPYLESKVASLPLPTVLRSMTPITEILYTFPTGPTYGTTTSGIIGPGASFAGPGWEFAIEALLPMTHSTGRGVGVTAQLSLALDYLFPDSILGHPLLSQN
jgi:hypothetical protein